MFTIKEILFATKGKLAKPVKDFSIRSFSTDSRSIKKNDAFIALKGDKFDGHLFIREALKKGASCIIAQSSAFGYQLPAKAPFIIVKDTAKALGDLARFNRLKFNIPIIAVTGSNGKTTAKEMIACVLSGKFKVLKNEGTKNNHIGLPQALCKLDASYQVGVLELGTNHFGEIKYLTGILRPNIGLITNIGPSHLENFSSLSGVFKEKSSLMASLISPHIGVLNQDDAFLRKISGREKLKPFIFGFGIDRKSDFTASDIRASGDKISFLVKGNKFTLCNFARHNIYNAMAAIVIGRIFGLSYRQISQRLAGFSSPKGRFNIFELSGATFIDDTYNSNPLSFRAALEALENYKKSGRKIVVMGDMLELGADKESFHRKAFIDAARVSDCIITVGPLSKMAAEAAQKAGAGNIFTCFDPHQARDVLFNQVYPRKNDVILVKGSRSMRMEGVFI